jgi:hypothetical protein
MLEKTPAAPGAVPLYLLPEAKSDDKGGNIK